MVYRIFTLKTFDEVYAKLDGSEQQWIQKIKKQFEQQVTGKILHFSWLREKKYLNKRLYYLIDEEQKKILFIAFAPKKEQQSIINQILMRGNELLLFLRRL